MATKEYVYMVYVYGMGMIPSNEAKEYEKIERQHAKDRVFGCLIPQTKEQINKQMDEDKKHYLKNVEAMVFEAYNKYFEKIFVVSTRIKKIEEEMTKLGNKKSHAAAIYHLEFNKRIELDQQNKLQDQINRLLRRCLNSALYTLDQLYISERMLWRCKMYGDNFIKEWMDPIVWVKLSVETALSSDNYDKCSEETAHSSDNFDKEINELGTRAEHYFYKLYFTERCIKNNVNEENEKNKRDVIKDKLRFIADEIERLEREKKEYDEKKIKIEISSFFDKCNKYLLRDLSYESMRGTIAKEIKNKQREILKQLAIKCMIEYNRRAKKNEI